jgi:hypothetical protein
MLNKSLEKNHEEMFEYHFKHEIMENQLHRKKGNLISAQALIQKMKLVMACEDPNYRVSLAKTNVQ